MRCSCDTITMALLLLLLLLLLRILQWVAKSNCGRDLLSPPLCCVNALHPLPLHPYCTSVGTLLVDR